MTTEPYTPDEADLIIAVALNFPEDEARSGIAKIKADALREAAIGATAKVNNAEAAEADISIDPSPYHHGARYGMRKTAQWLHDRADRIEEEA